MMRDSTGTTFKMPIFNQPTRAANMTKLRRYLGCILPLLVYCGASVAVPPVGSVALYSDGKVEKLLMVEKDRQLWEDDRKRRFLRSSNPVMPILERTEFLGDRGYRQSLVEGDPDEVNIDSGGSPVAFTVLRERHDGSRVRRQWKCSHLGRQQKDVLGEVRMLDRFNCERFILHRKTWQPIIKESREFLFSPALGMVVEMRRTRGEKTREWKLVSLLPAGKADYTRLSKRVRKLRATKADK